MSRLRLGADREETPSPGNSVNLLSGWVLEEIEVRTLRRRFALGSVAVLVAVVGVWGFESFSLRDVRTDLAAERATTTALQGRIEALAPVRTYVDGVRGRAVDVQTAMRTDVSFGRTLLALQDATPAGLEIEDLAVSLLPTDQELANATAQSVAGTTAPPPDGSTPVVADEAEDPESDFTRGLSGAACPGPDPFDTTPSIGCVTISGSAEDRDAVSALVEALSRETAFVEPFITTTTTDAAETGDGTGATAGASVTFSGTVGLTPKVFSGRYDGLIATLGLQERS